MGQVTGNWGQLVLQSALKTRIGAWPAFKKQQNEGVNMNAPKIDHSHFQFLYNKNFL